MNIRPQIDLPPAAVAGMGEAAPRPMSGIGPQIGNIAQRLNPQLNTAPAVRSSPMPMSGIGTMPGRDVSA